VGAVLVLAERGGADDGTYTGAEGGPEGGPEGGTVRRSTRELLTLARRIGEPVTALCGPADPAHTDVLARYGSKRVFTVAESAGDECAGVTEAEALVTIARRIRPTAVLIASGRKGQQIAARVAVRLDSGIITDAVDVYAGPHGLVAVQEAYAGSCAVGSSVRNGTAVITVRAGAVEPEAAAEAARPVIECMQVKSSSAAYGVRLISRTAKPAGSRPELATAPVVVAGGRGVGSASAFELLRRVAAAFGGAVGGSAAAADLGWCPSQMRIDQTGVTVRPRLYLACGISGSVRHRAGMQHARTIVAIDKDPAAPIFRIADFGVIGDLRQVLPALLVEIARRRGISVDDLMEA
jgi:electron transfer flavoprotein alpha subunit